MSETTADAKPVPPAEAEKKKEESLPFFKLFSFADKFDYLLMITGTLGAIVHGSSMPVFFLLFGEMVNGFGKNQMDLHQMTHEVSRVKKKTFPSVFLSKTHLKTDLRSDLFYVLS